MSAWDDLNKLTDEELFDELEYRLDEAGVRFLNILRGRHLSLEMERDQANERTRNLTEALLRAEENRWAAH